MNKSFMQKAIALAQGVDKDIPVAAIIVKDDKIISQSVNQKELKQNPILHAEISAIDDACKKLGTWHLDDCDMYVTLEPCPMCAGAIIQARIKNLYFGSFDNLYGALGSKTDLRQIINSPLNVKGGILEEECNQILEKFFEELRNEKQSKKRIEQTCSKV